MSSTVRHQLNGSESAILKAVAAATTKVLSEAKSLSSLKSKAVSETTFSESELPADSVEIDLEHESIHKKRERQRSLVLNLGRKVE